MDLNVTVGNTAGNFELGPLLDTPTTDLVGKDGFPTNMSALCWINIPLNNSKGGVGGFIPELFPIFLRMFY